MLKRRTTLFAGTALAAALALTSCAGGGPATSPTMSSETEAAFSDADVTFAQAMLPHHEQAVEMSETLLAKANIGGDVRDLATTIKTAQEPEIAQLKEWLTQWRAGEHDMDDMDDMGTMDGMMSSDDMAMFEDASGAEASTLFLEQMTVHHEGAVDMAQREIANGQNADALTMAANIVKTQTAEIAVMEELLATL